ncbi:hypothetical protein BAE44_0009537 [Dichanthelium oligosanthes]|uniref:Uncharacterized protein n=1 Tax=Dichanthelium oligosanthes TaxID=888268 RepID=A0A1E5VWF3_9POAL|nr:hypothetical protein BAE44_0009537 [Dichanthelium oligosanthes]
MAAPRKLSAAASLAAKQALGFGAGPGDGALPWDVVGEKLAELLRFLASAVQALAAELREHAASLYAALAVLARTAISVALPAAAAAAVLLVVCACCVAAGQRRRRGPDGEETEGLGGGGPVVSYRGGYKGGIFSMHPNKPVVC